MDEALRLFGFNSFWTFREKVLVAIQETDQDIGKWLPEWSALQEAPGRPIRRPRGADAP